MEPIVSRQAARSETSKKRRPLELAVISDVHLGTRGARFRELTRYLKSIKPKTLVLNGDIIDIWQFSTRYWPNGHTKVLKQILHLSSKGTRVVYLTGNHDEKLRKFAGLSLGNLEIRNDLVLTLPTGERAWFFHGDVLDVVMQHSKWLARLGAISYDLLIALNIALNSVRDWLKLERISLSKRVKNNVKSAVAFINRFEETAVELAAQRGYDHVICGHIHQPADRQIAPAGARPLRYLNSGDWIENLTALEFAEVAWNLYHYSEEESNFEPEDATIAMVDRTERELFAELLAEFTALAE